MQQEIQIEQEQDYEQKQVQRDQLPYEEVSLFRSQEMGMYNLVMPRESAWDLLNALGEIDCIHFIDQNTNASNFQRPFSKQMKRCDELLQKVELIEKEIISFKKTVVRCEDVSLFLANLKENLQLRQKEERTYFDEIEVAMDRKYTDILQQVGSYESIIEQQKYLTNYRTIMIKSKQFMGNSYFSSNLNEMQEIQPELEQKKAHTLQFNIQQQQQQQIQLSMVSGIITAEDSQRFERIVFRASKGTALCSFLAVQEEEHFLEYDELDLEQAEQQERYEYKHLNQEKYVPQVVFIILFTAGGFDVIKKKVDLICTSFGVTRYQLPQNQNAFNKKLLDLCEEIKQTNKILKLTYANINTLLDSFVMPSNSENERYNYSLIEEYKLLAMKEKILYHTMNMLLLVDQIFYGKCWIEKAKEDTILQAIQDLRQRRSNIVGAQIQEIKQEHIQNTQVAPTHFKLNDFAFPFQELVNTYGVPRYREVNPALFTIITFPFLFGVMFGDIGHGLLLFLFGGFLLYKHDAFSKSKDFKTLDKYRYMLFLMGFFALYCGFIYNDFVSISPDLFGSCYKISKGGSLEQDSENCVYAFGVDPAWSVSSNDVKFYNSFKMKVAVILGVIQMCVGILMKACNNFFFRQPWHFLFECLPQLVFMLFIFGYMVFLIVLKWLTDFSSDTSKAPSIINLLVNTPLTVLLGSDKTTNGSLQVDGGEEFTNKNIQLMLLLCAVLCVPLMLIPKQFLKQLSQKLFKSEPTKQTIQKYANQNVLQQGRQKNQQEINYDVEEEDQLFALDNTAELEIKPFQDSKQKIKDNGPIVTNFKAQAQQISPKDQISGQEDSAHKESFITQLIETIEFVLGSISNTASYLRLWALSLAHSQLAKVFYDKTIAEPVKNGSIVGIIVGFMVFANLTFGILMCMDLMECFLHALRLHWVEFQNKFYAADGYKFEPFSFKHQIQNDLESKE